jgi:rhomboid protease GluP
MADQALVLERLERPLPMDWCVSPSYLVEPDVRLPWAAALIGCSDDRASGNRMTDLVEVGRFKTLADARQQVLVLAAVGIDCDLLRADREIGLYVASIDVEQAVQELACYERENLPSGQRPLPARPARHAVDGALAYCSVLLFFFGAERRHALSVDWAAIGAAQAGLIRDGAWWRTITALSLHADLLHLLSNLASGVIFGIFVAQLLGSGLAWGTILLAGALGNALIALVQAPEHAAIGASTGIFGALGILSGYMRRSRVVPWRAGFVVGRRLEPESCFSSFLASAASARISGRMSRVSRWAASWALFSPLLRIA